MIDEIEYEIVGHLPNGQNKLKFTNTNFNDIIFVLGKVSFDELDDGVKLNYEYNVLEHTKEHNKQELDKLVGDFVMQLLDDGVKDNSLIYTGGIDENRNPDTKQSDIERGLL